MLAQIRGDPCCQLLEVGGRVFAHTHKQQPRQVTQVNRLQLQAARQLDIISRATVHHLARLVITPSVLWADDFRTYDTGFLLQDARATMAARVVEGGNRAVVLAQDENRIRPDLVGLVITRLGDLRLTGYKQPVARENVLQVGGIHPLVTEERARQRKTRRAGVEKRADVVTQIEVVHAHETTRTTMASELNFVMPLSKKLTRQAPRLRRRRCSPIGHSTARDGAAGTLEHNRCPGSAVWPGLPAGPRT